MNRYGKWEGIVNVRLDGVEDIWSTGRGDLDSIVVNMAPGNNSKIFKREMIGNTGIYTISWGEGIKVLSQSKLLEIVDSDGIIWSWDMTGFGKAYQETCQGNPDI